MTVYDACQRFAFQPFFLVQYSVPRDSRKKNITPITILDFMKEKNSQIQRARNQLRTSSATRRSGITSRSAWANFFSCCVPLRESRTANFSISSEDLQVYKPTNQQPKKKKSTTKYHTWDEQREQQRRKKRGEGGETGEARYITIYRRPRAAPHRTRWNVNVILAKEPPYSSYRSIKIK